ncbi:hypothetical protein [Microtetraspora malaysiensis]|uniref:hypothetical protein n=1 Tax=Microtetraspora malaysiensis TaxID=161358 RepID=UPI003D8EA1D4
MIKVGVIIGSTRPGRNGEAVAHWIHDLVTALLPTPRLRGRLQAILSGARCGSKFSALKWIAVRERREAGDRSRHF